MQPDLNADSKTKKRYNQRTFLLLASTSFLLKAIWVSIYSYKLSGFDLYDSDLTVLTSIILYSTFELFIVLLVDKIVYTVGQSSKNRMIRYIPVLLLVIYILPDLLVRAPYFRFNEIIYFHIIFYGILGIPIIYILIKEFSKSTFLTETDVLKTNIANESDNDEKSEVKNIPTILNNVILTIKQRANSSTKAVTVSLVSIIFIVILGGLSSFGTVAFNEVKKVRELEKERVKLLQVAALLKLDDTSKYEARNREVVKLIKSRYGNQESYGSIIKKVEEQAYVSWPDIAMRITIAALTIFLVQIFFHIYKYNQQQESSLLTKAEILELFNEDGADQAELRSVLLSKISSESNFDKSPTPLTEQIINIIKSKDSS